VGPARAGAARAQPLTVRLVKAPTGTTRSSRRASTAGSAVFDVKADSGPQFEQLTRRLLDARRRARRDRLAQLRSIGHAIAYNRLSGGRDEDLELQILRVSATPEEAIASLDLRVRALRPVGDLVAGWPTRAPLLEKHTNDSFLADQAAGKPWRSCSRRPRRVGFSRRDQPRWPCSWRPGSIVVEERRCRSRHRARVLVEITAWASAVDVHYYEHGRDRGTTSCAPR
jgi:hypothetical protein